MSCFGLLLSICLISQLPNHGGSLRQLPASESPPISPGLAQMLPSPCLSIATMSLSLQKEK